VIWITQQWWVLNIVFELSQRKKEKLFNKYFISVWNYLFIYTNLFLFSFFKMKLNLSCEQNMAIYQQLCMKNFAEEPICHFPNIFLFSFFCSDSVDTKTP